MAKPGQDAQADALNSLQRLGEMGQQGDVLQQRLLELEGAAASAREARERAAAEAQREGRQRVAVEQQVQMLEVELNARGLALTVAQHAIAGRDASLEEGRHQLQVASKSRTGEANGPLNREAAERRLVELDEQLEARDRRIANLLEQFGGNKIGTTKEILPSSPPARSVRFADGA